MLVIEMNPRVSRSSALASKATGFPIARVGAKLAVGYTPGRAPQRHHEDDPRLLRAGARLRGVKFPRFAFEKFAGVNPVLGVQMKAVGETMAIGRTFRSAWQKGLRAWRSTAPGGSRARRWRTTASADDHASLLAALRRPTWTAPSRSSRALEGGAHVEEIYEASAIDPWFLDQLQQILELEAEYAMPPPRSPPRS
jgi:carbamoyl-phosphate synthase large subunit